MISPVHGQFTALKNKNMSYIVIYHVSINSNVSLLNLSGRDIPGGRPAQGGTITICFFSPKSENSLSKKCTILTDLFSQDRSGVGIRSSIQKCSALTLQQIYRLAESQHDDWLSGAFPVGSERKTLLEALKYMLEEPEEVNRDEVMQKDRSKNSTALSQNSFWHRHAENGWLEDGQNA